MCVVGVVFYFAFLQSTLVKRVRTFQYTREVTFWRAHSICKIPSFLIEGKKTRVRQTDSKMENKGQKDTMREQTNETDFNGGSALRLKGFTVCHSAESFPSVSDETSKTSSIEENGRLKVL